MNRKIKIIVSILGLAAISVYLFIGVGLYAMEIEDTYEDLDNMIKGGKLELVIKK